MHFKFLAVWGLMLGSTIASPMPKPAPKPSPEPAPTFDGTIAAGTVFSTVVGTAVAVGTLCYNRHIKRKEGQAAIRKDAWNLDKDMMQEFLKCFKESTDPKDKIYHDFAERRFLEIKKSLSTKLGTERDVSDPLKLQKEAYLSASNELRVLMTQIEAKLTRMGTTKPHTGPPPQAAQGPSTQAQGTPPGGRSRTSSMTGLAPSDLGSQQGGSPPPSSGLTRSNTASSQQGGSPPPSGRSRTSSMTGLAPSDLGSQKSSPSRVSSAGPAQDGIPLDKVTPKSRRPSVSSGTSGVPPPPTGGLGRTPSVKSTQSKQSSGSRPAASEGQIVPSPQLERTSSGSTSTGIAPTPSLKRRPTGASKSLRRRGFVARRQLPLLVDM